MRLNRLCTLGPGLLVFALLAGGCKSQGAATTTAASKAKPAAKGESRPAEPVKKAQTARAKVPARPVMHAGAHILIAYKGAMRAHPAVTRTKAEALKLAREVAAKAQAAPGRFAELARKYSDGPSAGKGGDLGAWPRGRMVPQFDNALDHMKVGDISAPVESPFGFHIIKRNPAPPMFSGSHILVAYKGAMRAAATVTRTKAEARALAKDLAAQARKDPGKFAELAKKHSDGPSGSTGGHLGVWPRGRMVPAFDKAIEKLKVGEISDPVETPFGFHVIKREDPYAQPPKAAK